MLPFFEPNSNLNISRILKSILKRASYNSRIFHDKCYMDIKGNRLTCFTHFVVIIILQSGFLKKFLSLDDSIIVWSTSLLMACFSEKSPRVVALLTTVKNSPTKNQGQNYTGLATGSQSGYMYSWQTQLNGNLLSKVQTRWQRYQRTVFLRIGLSTYTMRYDWNLTRNL